MAICKFCGREIRWIKTWGGNSMPCDPDEITYWADKRSRERIITKNGEVKACRFSGKIENATGIGYRPHWDACEKETATGKGGTWNGKKA